MRIRLLIAVVAAGLIATACGKHPLHGGWQEHIEGGGPGLQLEFDDSSTRMQVHTRPQGGSHEHLAGTYTLEGEVVKVEWTEAGTKVQLSGKLTGDELVLTGADGKSIEFHRGEADHKH